jgi:adenylosuccinate lyase
MRGYMCTASENIALWHERDISHSSTERIVLPDATMLLDYMLSRFEGILDNLVVYPENMLYNIGLTHGAIFAQRVMNALIEKGFVREQAYDLVQPVAMKTLMEGGEMQENLKLTEGVTAHLTAEEIDACFSLDYYMKNVDYIFEQVGI